MSEQEQILRADRAETALRERERQLARVLEMADAWEETYGDGKIIASMGAGALRRTIRGLEHAP